MFKNILKKMDVELKDVVHYTLKINEHIHDMNSYIGKHIKIEWSGVVICSCGKEMNGFYRNSARIINIIL